jgi:cholesterol transport system auxiliary component
MISMRFRIPIAGPLALGLALAACQLPGTGEPPQIYTLSPKSIFAADQPRVEWQLIVEAPISAASLNTARIVVQRSSLQIDYFARSNWSDTAPLLVQTLLIESFENTGKIVAVSREATNLRADYLLKTELREFQAEFDGSGPPQVRVRINGKMVRLPERTIIASQTSERVIRAERSDMASIVEAFDEALGKVLKEQVDWALRAPGTTRRTNRPGT